MGISDCRKILLIHPETGFWDMMRSAPSMPLNLLHATSLMTTEFDVRIFDIRMCKNWRSELAALCRERPLLAGITSMLGHSARNAIEAARIVKTETDCPVLLAGPLPSLVPDTAIRSEYVDFVIRGEGEQSLVKLAEALLEDSPAERIPGVTTKVTTSGFADTTDLESAPEIPYRLIDVAKYFQIYDGVPGYLPMETSRGCNCGCLHCHNSIPGNRGWRAQSAGRVIDRATLLKNEFGAAGIYFVDDNFFMDTGRAMEIADGLGRLGLKWQIQGIDILKLNKLSDSEIKSLADSGLTRITIGIETGSDEIRDMVRKKLKAEEVINSIRRMSKFPIITYCSFITNFPGEKYCDVEMTSKMIATLIDVNPNFRNSPVYQYVPIPGTETASRAEKAGYKPPEKYENWGDISFETGCGIDSAGLGINFYKAFYFVTLFCDGKHKEYVDSAVIRLLSALYQPIAKLRLKKFLFKPVPEMRIFFILKKLLEGKKRPEN